MYIFNQFVFMQFHSVTWDVDPRPNLQGFQLASRGIATCGIFDGWIKKCTRLNVKLNGCQKKQNDDESVGMGMRPEDTSCWGRQC